MPFTVIVQLGLANPIAVIIVTSGKIDDGLFVVPPSHHSLTILPGGWSEGESWPELILGPGEHR